MKARRKSPVNTIITEPQQCSTDLRLKILARLPFFVGLPAKALEEINRRFVEVGYQPGERIYTAGDPSERLFVVAEGRVKLLQHAAGGRDILLDLLTSGEFFGNLAILGVASYPDTAHAQAPACVLSIRAEDFRQVLDAHPELALKTLQVLGERLNNANRRVLLLSAMPVEQRIAFLLLELSAKFGRAQELGLLIDVPLSRDDLAEMAGTTPESVSRVLSQLQSRGMITSGRQWIAITDRAGLEALAGPA
ncbi:MAG: Crp/Fnr family transcriptional regulator [Anaerolineales bacterium]|nr:Crp/Fnr family transcriptional regulator [Anaerolineales bacterium]